MPSRMDRSNPLAEAAQNPTLRGRGDTGRFAETGKWAQPSPLQLPGFQPIGTGKRRMTEPLGVAQKAWPIQTPAAVEAPASASKKVAILLCTLHGQHYLEEQLQSVSEQTYPHWEVFASDDGSEDDTRALLLRHQADWPAGKLELHSGPAEGFAANFLSLICNAGIQADYYAFADQDDVWEPNKLERAVAWLRTVPDGVPALYGTRTRLVDADNQVLGLSPLFPKTPSFANALMQNIAGGNTMVFNKAARKLLREAGENIDVVTHDWWVYLVVSGCGGRVFYDEYPSLRYRQHDDNAVGQDNDWRARLHRIRLLAKGRFKAWTDRNVVALERISTQLTPENRQTLETFKAARTRWLLPRLWGFRRAGIHRQTVMGNLGLFVAALFNKV